MDNRELKMKVAEFIIQWDRETGGIRHDTHAYIFPVAAALSWRDVTVGLANEYSPAMGVDRVEDDEEDVQGYYDVFATWTKEEMEALSISLELLWDAATEREEQMAVGRHERIYGKES